MNAGRLKLLNLFSLGFLLFSSLLFCACYAQHNLGLTIGPTAGRLMDLSKNDSYHTKCNVKGGALFGVYYESKEDSIPNLYGRFGLQYQYQLTDLEVDGNDGHYYSSYNNIDYRFQQVRFSMGFGILLTPKKKVDLRILCGLWGSRNFRNHIKGNSWYRDGPGVEDYKQEEFDRFDIDAIRKFGAGVSLGWSIGFPINEHTSFLVQNEYHMNFNRFPRIEGGTPPTFLLTGVLGFGVSFSIQ